MFSDSINQMHDTSSEQASSVILRALTLKEKGSKELRVYFQVGR